MAPDFGNLFGTIASSLVLAIGGWLVRRIRKYMVGLRHAQEDISTIWVHLKLPRNLRSGSYRYLRADEEKQTSVLGINEYHD